LLFGIRSNRGKHVVQKDNTLGEWNHLVKGETMKKESVRLFVALSILCFITLTLSSTARAQDETEKVYKAKCAVCHGPDGSSETPTAKKLGAKDLRSPEVQGQSDAQLEEAITKGKNKMPAYAGKLKPEEIKGLVAYIRELAKKKAS
jgi:cytochrome c6